MDLRLAQIEDIPAINELCRASVADAFPGMGFSKEQVDQQLGYVGDPDVVRQWIENTQLWVYEKDGILLGVAGLALDPWTAYFGFHYVARRGQGVGSKLLQHCIGLAREAGCRWILAEVLQDNTLGQAHLSRHGFRHSKALRYTGGKGRMPIQLWAMGLTG